MIQHSIKSQRRKKPSSRSKNTHKDRNSNHGALKYFGKNKSSVGSNKSSQEEIHDSKQEINTDNLLNRFTNSFKSFMGWAHKQHQQDQKDKNTRKQKSIETDTNKNPVNLKSPNQNLMHKQTKNKDEKQCIQAPQMQHNRKVWKYQVQSESSLQPPYSYASKSIPSTKGTQIPNHYTHHSFTLSKEQAQFVKQFNRNREQLINKIEPQLQIQQQQCEHNMGRQLIGKYIQSLYNMQNTEQVKQAKQPQCHIKIGNAQLPSLQTAPFFRKYHIQHSKNTKDPMISNLNNSLMPRQKHKSYMLNSTIRILDPLSSKEAIYKQSVDAGFIDPFDPLFRQHAIQYLLSYYGNASHFYQDPMDCISIICYWLQYIQVYPSISSIQLSIIILLNRSTAIGLPPFCIWAAIQQDDKDFIQQGNHQYRGLFVHNQNITIIWPQSTSISVPNGKLSQFIKQQHQIRKEEKDKNENGNGNQTNSHEDDNNQFNLWLSPQIQPTSQLILSNLRQHNVYSQQNFIQFLQKKYPWVIKKGQHNLQCWYDRKTGLGVVYL